MKILSPPLIVMNSLRVWVAVSSFCPIALAVEAGPAFHYESLKGKSDGHISLFMGGKQAPDRFGMGSGEPTSFPEKQWLEDPKTAALRFIESNRSPEENKEHPVKFRGDAPLPPRSGWIVYRWTSSGCYSLSTSLTAVRF